MKDPKEIKLAGDMANEFNDNYPSDYDQMMEEMEEELELMLLQLRAQDMLDNPENYGLI